MAKKQPHPLDIPDFLKIPQEERDRYWKENPPVYGSGWAPPVEKKVDPALEKFEAEEAERKRVQTKNRISKMKARAADKELALVPPKFRRFDPRSGRYIDDRPRFQRRYNEALVAIKRVRGLPISEDERRIEMATTKKKAAKTAAKKTTKKAVANSDRITLTTTITWVGEETHYPEGSKMLKNFNKLSKGMVVADYVKAGGAKNYIWYFRRDGYVKTR